MEVGQKLFAARQRRGLSLDDLSRTTKIPVALLQAIERDDIARLPQGFFTRAFVRTYAAEVGLDPEDVLHTFDRIDVEEEVPTHVATDIPMQEPRASKSFVFAMTLAGACAMFYSGYASHLLTRGPAAAETPATIRAETIAVAVPPCASIAPLPVTIEPERRTTTIVRASAAVPETVSVTYVVPDNRPQSTEAEADTPPDLSDAIVPPPDAVPSPAPVQEF